MIDQTAHTVTVDGRQIELSFKEFELLTYFMENEGIALSRKRFLIMSGTMIISGTPEQSIHMSKLRAKIGEKEITSKPSGAWVTNLKQKKMAVISNDEKQEKEFKRKYFGSLTHQLILISICLVTGTLLCAGLSTRFLEPYYVINKQNTLLSGFETIDEASEAGTLDDSSLM